MITHTVTPLPHGKFLLKTIWSSDEEVMIVHASELDAEEAYKLADAINSVRPVPSEQDAAVLRTGSPLPPDSGR